MTSKTSTTLLIIVDVLTLRIRCMKNYTRIPFRAFKCRAFDKIHIKVLKTEWKIEVVFTKTLSEAFPQRN